MTFFRTCVHVALAVLVAAVTSLASLQASAAEKRQQMTPEQQAAEMEKKQRAKEADDAYRASLRVIPNKQPTKSDPWSGMR